MYNFAREHSRAPEKPITTIQAHHLLLHSVHSFLPPRKRNTLMWKRTSYTKDCKPIHSEANSKSSKTWHPTPKDVIPGLDKNNRLPEALHRSVSSSSVKELSTGTGHLTQKNTCVKTKRSEWQTHLNRRLIVQATTLYSAFVYSFAARHTHRWNKIHQTTVDRRSVALQAAFMLYATRQRNRMHWNTLDRKLGVPPGFPSRQQDTSAQVKNERHQNTLDEQYIIAVPPGRHRNRKPYTEDSSNENLYEKPAKTKKGRVDIKRVCAQEIRLVNGKAAKCQQGLSANLYVCTEMPAVKSIRILHLSRRHYWTTCNNIQHNNA